MNFSFPLYFLCNLIFSWQRQHRLVKSRVVSHCEFTLAGDRHLHNRSVGSRENILGSKTRHERIQVSVLLPRQWVDEPSSWLAVASGEGDRVEFVIAIPFAVCENDAGLVLFNLRDNVLRT